MTTDYAGPERRGAALTEDKVQLMIATALTAALQAHDHKIIQHMDGQFAQLRNTFQAAFPGGDPHGHRIAHEKAIKNATWWDSVKSEAVTKLATAGLWAIVVFLAVAAWEHIKSEARK